MSGLLLRWTVGDVSARGWEALRLSVYCAMRLFSADGFPFDRDVHYVVCVNSLPLEEAQARSGAMPAELEWQVFGRENIPPFLTPHLEPGMAEGVGWKLVPPQLDSDRHELALDNDCILFAMPAAVRAFLARHDATLLAEDVERCLGLFDAAAPPGAINSGLRGLPPGINYAARLTAALQAQQASSASPFLLRSELDEQGLQTVALHTGSPCLLVSREEVSICSPFWPRQPELGSCGAHFVGLNARHLPWNYYERTADVVRREHWDRHRPLLYERAGLLLPPALPIDVA